MTELVDPTEIEQIVGAARHSKSHLARAVSAERMVYILHSQECLDSGIDLRACDFSVALDRGIDERLWETFTDVPVQVVVSPQDDSGLSLLPLGLWRA